MKTIETDFGLVLLEDDDYVKLSSLENARLILWQNKVYIYKRGGSRQTLGAFLLGSRVQITHKDGNRLNFMRENIEKRDKSIKINKYYGVRKHKSGKFIVRFVNKEKVMIHVGLYSSEEVAAIAYNKAKDIIYGVGNLKRNKLQISEDEYKSIYDNIVVNTMTKKGFKGRSVQGSNQKSRKVTSKYTGVHKDNRINIKRERWVSAMSVGQTTIWIGVYDTEIEAAQAYNEVAILLYGKKARLNSAPKIDYSVIDIGKVKERFKKVGIEIKG